MTIEFKNVTKKVRLGPIRLTYKDLNIRVEQNAHVAFLGNKSAGLEAIMNLICGADATDEGHVRRTHSVSWPIPSTPFMQKHLTAAANARFVARLYEVRESDYLARVEEMSGLGDYLNTRVDQCPREVLARFNLALGLCLDFDQYLLTSTGGRAKDDRARFTEILERLGERAGILLVTQDVKAAQQFCTEAYVFDEGRATHFDDLEAASEFFSSVKSGGDEEDSDFFAPEPDLEKLVNVDF